MITNEAQAHSRSTTYTEDNTVQNIVDPLGLGALKMQEQIHNEIIHDNPSRFKWGCTDLCQYTAVVGQNDDDGEEGGEDNDE